MDVFFMTESRATSYSTHLALQQSGLAECKAPHLNWRRLQYAGGLRSVDSSTGQGAPWKNQQESSLPCQYKHATRASHDPHCGALVESGRPAAGSGPDEDEQKEPTHQSVLATAKLQRALSVFCGVSGQLAALEKQLQEPVGWAQIEVSDFSTS